MGAETPDSDRPDASARADAEEPVLTPEVVPPDPPEGDDCTDPGPGRYPRPDLRGA